MYLIIVSAQKETERESDPIKLSQSSSVAARVLHSISKCIKYTQGTKRIPTNKPNLAVNSRPVQTGPHWPGWRDRNWFFGSPWACAGQKSDRPVRSEKAGRAPEFQVTDTTAVGPCWSLSLMFYVYENTKHKQCIKQLVPTVVQSFRRSENYFQ